MDNKYTLGVDVGASGIKGAIIDTQTGELQTERLKIETPKPATPEAIANTFKDLVELHKWQGIIGCGFPSIIKQGIAYSAANIDPSCIGTNFSQVLSWKTGMPVYVLNDADAAGIAEIKFGRGKDVNGLVMLITIGSGLGSAMFIDGKLVPNSELGHFELHGMIAEKYASSATKKREDLSWEEWGGRFKEYLERIKRLFSPDLVILGGGISRKFDKFQPIIEIDGLNVVPAQFQNNAGSIGAALYAHAKHTQKIKGI